MSPVASQVPSGLDARLVRFRSRPTREEAGALAEDLRAASRWAEAAEVAAAGRAAGGDDLALWIAEGRAHLDAGDPGRAQAAFLEGARGSPKSPRAFRWLGEALLDRGDAQRAARVLDRALRLVGRGPPDDPELAALPALAERAERLARLAGPRPASPAPRPAPPPPPPPREDDTPTRVPGLPPLAPVDTSTRPFDASSLARSVSTNDEEPTVRAPSTPPPPAALGEAPPRSPMDVLAALPDVPLHPPPEDDADVDPGDAVDVELLPTEEGEAPATAVPQGDVAWGARHGQREDVDAVLRTLRDAGLVEASSAGAAWASPREARVARTRTTWPFAALWLLAVLAVAAGFGVWERRRAARQAEAAAHVEEGLAALRAGDAAGRREAERQLARARALHPREPAAVSAWLHARAARALADGDVGAPALAADLDRARTEGAAGWALAVARAARGALAGDPDAALAAAGEAVEARDTAETRWVLGRVAGRLGAGARALEALEHAVETAPDHAPAHLALAALHDAAGRGDDARAAVDAVLTDRPSHLRARLWQLVLAGDERAPDAVRADLRALQDRVRADGAPRDVVLAALVGAAADRRGGRPRAAAAALTGALAAEPGDPDVWARVTEEAARLGRADLAERAAGLALRLAPGRADLCVALGRALVARRDGAAALRVLAPLSMDDPAVLRASAEAALTAGSPGAVERAAAALEARGEAVEASPAEAALLLRLRARLEPTAAIPAARRLPRRFRDDPAVAVAAAEVWVEVGRGRDALRALRPALAAEPVTADAAWLAGRAHRLAGDAAEAASWLRRAVDTSDAHLDARLALGRLLLDVGELEAADQVFEALGVRAGRVAGLPARLAGRLGRVEAAVAAGRLEAAAEALASVPAQDRARPPVAHARALLALARGEAGTAVAILTPVAEAQGAAPATLALLGDAHARAGDPAAARARYAQALAFDGGLPEALVGLAELALGAGDDGEARRRAEEASRSLRDRLRPPAFRARAAVALGRAHLTAGRRHADEAVDALRGALDLAGAPASAWCDLARALALAGDPDGDVADAEARCPEREGVAPPRVK